jgi:hypothetical protein
VQQGATIQAQPPALEIKELPSGNRVPNGQARARGFIASGVFNHQSDGPTIIAISIKNTPYYLVSIIYIFR